MNRGGILKEDCMKKTYSYRFIGNAEDFANKVQALRSSKPVQLSQYILEVNQAGECRFGIQRGGHSGGYWYVPTVCQQNDGVIISGKIVYLEPRSNQSKFKKVMDGIGVGLLILLLLPIYIGIWIYRLVDWLAAKIRKKPKVTLENKLDYLMQQWLACEKL